jgi:prepilin peptidase CpaA
MNQTFQILVLCAWAALVAWTDWRSRRLPNLLTLGAVALAMLCLLFIGRSWTGAPVGTAWAGFATALLLTFPGYALGRLGAGDVKLLAAMGLLSSLHVLLTTFVIGALVGLLMVLWSLAHSRLREFLAAMPVQEAMAPPCSMPRAKHIPYGSALACGFVCALLPSFG